ncbi:hypothetical protein D9M72_551470 [compost metagenome]
MDTVDLKFFRNAKEIVGRAIEVGDQPLVTFARKTLRDPENHRVKITKANSVIRRDVAYVGQRKTARKRPVVVGRRGADGAVSVAGRQFHAFPVRDRTDLRQPKDSLIATEFHALLH